MKRLDTSGVRRILVRGTNWVGDAVMSVPALRELRARFPGAHIALLVRPWVRDVYGAADFVDEVLEYDRAGAHRGPAGFLRLARSLAERRFDLAVLLQNAFEAALLAWLARIPLRLGYARDGRSPLLTHACRIDPEARRAHQVYYYLGLLAGAGLGPEHPWADPGYRPSLGLAVRPEDRAAARALAAAAGNGGPLVALNAGAAYGGAKRWPAERFAAVADLLVERAGARVLLVGSERERSIAAEVAARMRARTLDLTGRTTLGELMGLLAECRLLVTNDSGPMHLAAALEVPQVAIFGSSSPEATGPLAADSRVARHAVPCSPCFLRECPIDFRCMLRLGVDEVARLALELLACEPRSRARIP
jgi:heptosyltransferase-2